MTSVIYKLDEIKNRRINSHIAYPSIIESKSNTDNEASTEAPSILLHI